MTLDGATASVVVSGDVTFGGHIVADADEAKNIFAAVTTASNAITIGGGGKVVTAGALEVTTTSTLTGDVTFGGDGVATIGRPSHSSGAASATVIVGQTGVSNGNGGDVVLKTGAKHGGGTSGSIKLQDKDGANLVSVSNAGDVNILSNTGTMTVTNDFTVNADVVLGDAKATDTLVINAISTLMGATNIQNTFKV